MGVLQSDRYHIIAEQRESFIYHCNFWKLAFTAFPRNDFVSNVSTNDGGGRCNAHFAGLNWDHFIVELELWTDWENAFTFLTFWYRKVNVEFSFFLVAKAQNLTLTKWGSWRYIHTNTWYNGILQACWYFQVSLIKNWVFILSMSHYHSNRWMCFFCERVSDLEKGCNYYYCGGNF